MHESQAYTRNVLEPWRGGYAEWIAVGALIAGSVGALVGARYCRRHGRGTTTSEPLDPASVTAPHGDKLEAALR